MGLPSLYTHIFTFFHHIIQRSFASLAASLFGTSVQIIDHF